MQALPALPESLCVVEMGGATEVDTGLISVGGMFLNIGLQNGVLLRTALDSVTGQTGALIVFVQQSRFNKTQLLCTHFRTTISLTNFVSLKHHIPKDPVILF